MEAFDHQTIYFRFQILQEQQTEQYFEIEFLRLTKNLCSSALKTAYDILEHSSLNMSTY